MAETRSVASIDAELQRAQAIAGGCSDVTRTDTAEDLQVCSGLRQARGGAVRRDGVDTEVNGG